MGGSRFLKGSLALHWNGGESDDSGDRASPFEKLHLNQSARCAGSHWAISRYWIMSLHLTPPCASLQAFWWQKILESQLPQQTQSMPLTFIGRRDCTAAEFDETNSLQGSDAQVCESHASSKVDIHPLYLRLGEALPGGIAANRATHESGCSNLHVCAIWL